MTEDERQLTIRRKLCASQDRPFAVLPTGIPEVDEVLTGGGLPRGRIVEIFGPDACGKSTFALRAAAATQQQGGTVALIDADHTFDPAQAREAGVDVDRLIVASPQWEEQALEIARVLAASGAVELIIVDSAAALVPKLELETNLEEMSPGLQGNVLTRALRTLAMTARRNGVCVLFLNQLRSAHGGEGAETSAGGRALKAYASVRAELRPVAGARRIHLRVVRNKLGASQETDIDIR